MMDFAQKDADLGGSIATLPQQTSAEPRPIANDPWADVPAPETGIDGPDGWDASFIDEFQAAWTDETITTDAWDYEEKKRRALADEMMAQLPSDAQNRVRQQMLDMSSLGQWKTFENAVMSEAAKIAPMSPETAKVWAPYPLTSEAFDARMKEENAANLEAARRVLDVEGGGIAEFLGRSLRAMTDETSVMLAPLGGFGGSAARVIGAEAILGAVGEAAVLPREYEVAERLDLPDPDPVTRILTGAALGGGLAAGVLGGVKALSYLRARRDAIRAATPPGGNHLETEARVDEAEAALLGNQSVQQRIGPPVPPSPEDGTLPAILATTGNASEDATLRAIVGAESGGNASAANASSSALGAGQFIASTWMAMVRKHRPDLLNGRTSNEVLELRKDGALSLEMTRLYMRENQAILRAEGITTVGPAETYLAHFMGPGGAAKALRVPLDTPISRLMGPAAIAANKGIRYNGKSFADFTAYDLRMWSRHKMRAAYGDNPPTDLPTFSGPTSRGYTGTGQVSVGDGTRIDVDYEVVDASTLLRASGEFQPRDRSRIASDAWIADTAARLDPAQLMPSPTADRGAPLVGPDNMIESGNGRFGAIERAYERVPDRANAYRAQIEAAGFAIPEGVSRPVLIARRKTELSPEDRVRLTIDAQDSGVAVMTPTEVARASSRAMTPPVLGQFDPAQPINAEANAGFVRAALAGLPRSARNAMFDGTGLLNSAGARQLREAIFARAWPDPDILARYTEGDAGELKSLMEALESSAPAWAALRADIERGTVLPEMDISAHVLDAMRLIGAARDLAAKQGGPIAKAVAELLDEVDLIEGAISPLTAAMVRKFWVNGRAAPADKVADFLTRYATDARSAGQAGGLFDAPGPRDVLVALDAPTFGALPADFGAARGYATPAVAAIQPMPASSFDQGAASPEAIEAANAGAADFRGPEPQTGPSPDAAQVGEVADGFDAELASARDMISEMSGKYADLTFEDASGLEVKASEMLDDLEADANAATVMQACGVTPTGAAA